MNDSAWELFQKTGLPQAYCYYKARERSRRDKGEKPGCTPS